MLVYHPESDALFWDPDFKFEGADGALCHDVSEELWAVERAEAEGIEFPEIERHLAYLRDLAENEPPPGELPPADDPYWEGL